jgi:O-antigen/teichoic acid export membrane protein
MRNDSSSARLGRNALWMVLARAGAQGLAVVFTVLLARRLGAQGLGAYAFIAAVLFVANALTTFGTDMLLIREIAAGEEEGLARLPAALVIQLALSVMLIALVRAGAGRIPNQSRETIAALQVYSLALVPLAFFTVFTTALRGLQRMEAYMILNLVLPALQVGVLLLAKVDLLELSIYLVVIQSAVAILAGFICALTVPGLWTSWRAAQLDIPALLKRAAPIALLALLGMVYQRLGIYMLAALTGAAETGLFSAAARAVEASKGIHLAVFAALYPAMARTRADSPERTELAEALRVSWKALLAGAALASVLLFALARPLVLFLYGGGFAASAAVLQVMAWILLPFTVNSYLTLSLLASNGEKFVGRALAVSLLGLLVLNLWWIPPHGAAGGAWAALAAECLQSVVLLVGASAWVRSKGWAHEFPKLP